MPVYPWETWWTKPPVFLPCPYGSNITFQMDLLQSMPHNEAKFNYDLMDFSDISSDLPDIKMMTSDADIPYLDDVSDAVWFI